MNNGNANPSDNFVPAAEYLATSGLGDQASAGTVSVQVVDVRAALGPSATADSTAAVAAELVASFRRTGFAVITGHGVPAEVLDDMCAVSREFFSLPLEEKIRVAFPAPEVIRGYEPVPDAAGEARAPNAMESFLINRLDTLGDYPEGSPEARLWRWPNLWPERPDTLRPVWERYYQEMEGLGNRLLGLVALGLGLPRDWFAGKFDRHFNNLASNHYPLPSEEVRRSGMLPNRPHTDHGALTLLYRPSEPGGLEVFAEGQWWKVPYMTGSLVLNVGDVLDRWTGGLLPATAHRVVPWAAGGLPPGIGRQSVAYFQQPNPDVMVAPAEQLAEEAAAARSGDREAPRPVSAGRHISRKELGQVTLDALGL
ncbi:MAG TPA: 2-oxoglutarate and iron-dependent oxygenase domain-containing protein [Trebonia sp.]|jgi:isopenicillin N synthase-like dioxygenase|nr:2-oxoglutarate and iron-dependent oxygenase domain-containing protein [Trebonia sp.]